MKFLYRLWAYIAFPFLWVRDKWQRWQYKKEEAKIKEDKIQHLSDLGEKQKRFFNAERSCPLGVRRLSVANKDTGEVIRITALAAAFLMKTNPEWHYTTKSVWRKYRKEIFTIPSEGYVDLNQQIKKQAKIYRKHRTAKPKVHQTHNGFRQHIQTIDLPNGKKKFIMHTTKPKQETKPAAVVPDGAMEKKGFLFTPKRKAA